MICLAVNKRKIYMILSAQCVILSKFVTPCKYCERTSHPLMTSYHPAGFKEDLERRMILKNQVIYLLLITIKSESCKKKLSMNLILNFSSKKKFSRKMNNTRISCLHYKECSSSPHILHPCDLGSAECLCRAII